MLFPVAERVANIVLFRNIPFNNKYEHHPFISNKFTYKGATKHLGGNMYSFLYAKKSNNEYYFDRLVLDTGFNFNYGNGLVTSVVLEVPHQFTDANYMSVTPIGTTRPYYFFITNVVISTASYTDNTSKITCTMTLELDVLATYQNDILDGFTGNVKTERKHCQRYQINNNTSLVPYCSDFSLSESVIGDCKPNLVKDVVPFELNIGTQTDVGLSDMKWFYVMYQGNLSFTSFNASFNSANIGGLQTPISCIVFPDAPYFIVRTRNNLFPTRVINRNDFLKTVYDDPAVYGIKVSPYPPFTSLSGVINGVPYQNECYRFFDTTLQSDAVAFVIDDTAIVADVTELNSRAIRVLSNQSLLGFMAISGNTDKDIYKASGLWLLTCNDNEYPYKNENFMDIETKPNGLVNKSAVYEPKMLFSPLTRYMLKAQYASGEEIHPELVACEMPLANYMSITTIATGYGGDLTFSTFPKFYSVTAGGNNVSQFYKTINKGFISSPSYTYPVGEDALKTFSTTQENTFRTQTTGKIVGGVLTTISGGIAMATGNYAVGVIGLTAGITSTAQAIMGAVAKYSDLENTPDTISALGGSVIHDYATGNTLHPYLCIYEITPAEKEMIYDFFYEYGYVVNRCCVFNKELYPSDYSDSKWVDTRLFTRTIFNYIKINENISGKLYGDIPPVVKDKINNILNNGVRLYTMFDTNFANPVTNLQELYEGNVYENMEVALTLN